MRWFLLTLALMGTSVWTSAGLAGDETHQHGLFCPRCHGTCYPTLTKAKETKTCWEVETKTICIPKVRFPWESKCCNKGCGKEGCVPPKCGRTKCVNVLVKREYECSTCKYTWDPDSHKNDNFKSDKVPAGGGPTTASPADSVPTPIEASVPQSNRRVAPASFEQMGQPLPAGRSYVDILTSLFK